jgi:hypothetical protein
MDLATILRTLHRRVRVPLRGNAVEKVVNEEADLLVRPLAGRMLLPIGHRHTVCIAEQPVQCDGMAQGNPARGRAQATLGSASASADQTRIRPMAPSRRSLRHPGAFACVPSRRLLPVDVAVHEKVAARGEHNGRSARPGVDALPSRDGLEPV